jgi:plasmid stability protein
LTTYPTILYCENMKNITVSVDDETHRRARIKAAEQETSVSALVKQFLTALAEGGNATTHLAREEKALRERIRNFSAADRLSRAELHDRRR